MTLHFTYDPANALDDGGSAATTTSYGKVGGVDLIYDTNSSTIPYQAMSVVNVTAIDLSSGNETYVLNIEGSNSATFASGVIQLSVIPVNAIGQYYLPLYNKQNNIIYRYLRLKKTLAGTTPSITLDGYLAPFEALDQLSFSQVTEQFSETADQWALTNDYYRTWSTGTATGGSGSDGKYPMLNTDGTTSLVYCPAAIAAMKDTTFVYPDEFDALAGSSTSYNSAPAIQAMIDDSYTSGRMPALRPTKRYRLADKITIDPGRTGLIGNGATLDFGLKTFTDLATNPNLILNGTFASGGTNWTVSANNTLAPDYSGGNLTWAGSTTSTYNYLEVGQQIIAPAGSTIRFTMKVNSISTVTYGPNTFRSLLVSMRNNTGTAAGSIGGGGNAASGASYTISNTASNYVPGGTYTYDFIITTANPYLRIQSNSPLSLDDVVIKVVPDNACILIRSINAGQGLRGHNYREFRDFKVAGNSTYTDLVDAIVFDTPTSGFSSRVNFYNVDVSDGVGRGLVFQNRLYLANFYSCRIVTSQACIDTLEGAADAGENIAFFGGNVGGGQIGVRNRGMAIRFFGTSIDFSRQWYVGTGSFYMRGGWLETNPPTTAGEYLIDVTGGMVDIEGLVQVDGSTTPVLDAPFRVGAGARLKIAALGPYNLHGTSEALCVGAGRFEFIGQLGAGKEIEGITKRDSLHNILGNGGSFEDPVISIPFWLTAGTNQQQIDKYTVGLAVTTTITGDYAQGEKVIVNTSTAPTSTILGAKVTSAGVPDGTYVVGYQTSGSFTGTTAIGSNVITSVSPAPTSSVNNNKYISGAGIPVGAKIISYSNSGSTVTLDKACTAAATGVTVSLGNILILSNPYLTASATTATITLLPSTTAKMTATISTDYAHSGTQSLKLAKTGSGSTPWSATIAIPIDPDRAVGAEWWYKIPGGLTGTTAIYFQSKFGRISGTGSTGIPVLSVSDTQFISDLPQTAIDIVAGRDWTKLSTSTNRVDGSSDHDGYSPTWATHLIITLNLASVPNNFVMYLDDIHVNMM